MKSEPDAENMAFELNALLVGAYWAHLAGSKRSGGSEFSDRLDRLTTGLPLFTRGGVASWWLFFRLYEDSMWSVSPMNIRNSVIGIGDVVRTVRNGRCEALV